MARVRPTHPCPHCGAPVPRGASACRECGSDGRTGWSEDADLTGLELPGGTDDFDYETWLRDQLGESSGRPPWRRHTVWSRSFWRMAARPALVLLLILLLILW